MDQSERADDDVHRIIGRRQLVHLAEVELAIGDTPPLTRHRTGPMDNTSQHGLAA